MNTIPQTGRWNEISSILNDNFSIIGLQLLQMSDASVYNKGVHESLDALTCAYPTPMVGSFAYVGTTTPYSIYTYTENGWGDSGVQGVPTETNFSEITIATEEKPGLMSTNQVKTLKELEQTTAELGQATAEISKKVIESVDVSELDSLVAIPTPANGKADYWLTKMSGDISIIIGRVFLFEDNLKHKVTQVVMSNQRLDDNYPDGSHDAGDLTICYRFYGHTGNDVPLKQWTPWKKLYDSEDMSPDEIETAISELKAKDVTIDEEIATLKQPFLLDSLSHSVSNGARNFNLFPRINGKFSTNLIWFDVSEEGKHIVIPVRPNDKIVIKANNARVAFAKSYTPPTQSGAIDGSEVEDFTRAITTTPDGKMYIVPEDCNYLVVQTYRDGTEYNFTEFTINEHNLLVDQTELLPFLRNAFAIGEKVVIEKQANYTGGYVSKNGYVTSSTNYGIQYIDVVKGDCITILNYTTPDVATIAKINDNETYTPLIVGPKTGYQWTTYFSDFTGRIAISGRYADGYDVYITKTSTQVTPASIIDKMQSEITDLVQADKDLTGEISNLHDACYVRNKVVNYSTIFYGQIVNGVVNITGTNTRWIYYFPVKKGDKVYFSGTVSSNKGIAYGCYTEEPKEGAVAVDFGEIKDNGQAYIEMDIANDGFFGVSLNASYTKDLEIGFLFPVKEVVGPLHELKDDYRPTKIKYIPHRGIRDSEIPENTTYSVMFAALYGIKYAECDVRYTSDGVGVVMHDTTVNRTMYNKDLTTISGSVAIADNTFETLSQYVYKSTNPVYRTGLQTMKEYIDSCSQWDVCPIIQGSMSDEDLEYCMLRLGDNWICYGGNFEKVRAYSPNVLCLTSASYDSVDAMVTALSKISGRVGLSRLHNDQLTDEYIAACKANRWEVMASYAYEEQNIPDAIRRGVTIVLADNMGKETNKILASSLSGWETFTHEGVVANGVLTLSAGQTLTYNLSEKGSYKIYAQFTGQGLFNLPTYGDSGNLVRTDFQMDNNVFQYVFLVTTRGHDITISASTEMTISRLIIFHE
jgi:hypothetical protein